MPNIWIILIKSSTVTSSSYFAYWMKYDFYYLQQKKKNPINGSEDRMFEPENIHTLMKIHTRKPTHSYAD